LGWERQEESRKKHKKELEDLPGAVGAFLSPYRVSFLRGFVALSL
jgi:hypothetical protein